MSKPQEASSVVVNTSLGMMRPATYHEITAALRNLEARAEWEAVCDFAQQLFEDVIVYDAENNSLPYDLALPYWSQVEPDHPANTTALLQDFSKSLEEEEAKAETPLSQKEREQCLQEYTQDYVRDNNLYANEFDLPREDATFALDEPPPVIAGPALYVLCDQEAKQQEARNQDTEEREQRTCTIDFTMRGNSSLHVDEADQATEDAKALLECLDISDEQITDFTIFDVEVY